MSSSRLEEEMDLIQDQQPQEAKVEKTSKFTSRPSSARSTRALVKDEDVDQCVKDIVGLFGKGGCGLCVLTVIVYWAVAEATCYVIASSLNFVLEEVEFLPFGEAGIDVLAKNDEAYFGKSVGISGVSAVPSEVIVEDVFGFEFDNAVSVSRNTEYCQFQEHVVGINEYEDSRRSGPEGDDSAEGPTSPGEGPTGDDDASNPEAPEDDDEPTPPLISYEYSKGWRDRLIDSSDFYGTQWINPTRDPFPSNKRNTGVKFGRGKWLYTEEDIGFCATRTSYVIPDDFPLTLSAYRKRVRAHDQQHVYSLISVENDWTNPGPNLGPWSYQSDHILSRRNCIPGDVRASWKYDRLHPFVGLVGKYVGAGEIVPLQLTTLQNLVKDTVLLNILCNPGEQDVAEEINKEIAGNASHLWWTRIICFFVVAVYAFVMLGLVPLVQKLNRKPSGWRFQNSLDSVV